VRIIINFQANPLEELSQAWLKAKAAEEEAKAARVAVEEKIEEALQIPESFEGSKTHEIENFKLRVSRKNSQKIDSKKLVEIATQKKLEPLLQKLFRWKPEIKKKDWDRAKAEVRLAFSEAITTTPGKVSIRVEENE
jgi:hypothetical protein